MKYIKLIKNSKQPIQKWKDENKNIILNNTYDIKPDTKYNNYGVICGEVSNIIVVDIDLDKMTKDNIFLVTFPDYLNINTYIVQSRSGGYHLYFKYDKDLYNVASNIFVDIRSDGGYIVGEGSIIDGKQYKIYKNNDIIECPEDMKEFLLKYVCKRKEKKEKKERNNKDDPNCEYLENLEDKDIDKLKNKIIKCLDKEKQNKNFFKSYDEFLFFTTAMKKLNLQKSWDEFNKTQDNYNSYGNLKIWNSCDNMDLTPWLLKKLNFTAYELYKPILKDKIKPDIIINKNKLGKIFEYEFENVGKVKKYKDYIDGGNIEYDDRKRIITKTNNYIIKSDTGTGKTTSFKEYIKETKLKFISICSRVSLCQSQYMDFCENGVDCVLYTIDNIEYGDNGIIQLDSISKLYNIKDFSDYVIFLDEFNSIICYLLQSSTLKNHRLIVFELLINILKNCKQFICVDADISDMSIKFIDFINKDYIFINNSYLHNKGVKAIEIFEYDIFIDKMKNEKSFLCCCDSKTQAEIILKKLDDPKIKLITSETDEYIDFDEYEKIIYSPKIIYGIDSTLKRPVYCLYTTKTISPKAYLQQIARCRNIEKLYFLFTKKDYTENRTTYEEHKEYLKNINDYSLKEFKMLAPKDIYDLYYKLVCHYDYNELCYNTNKFGHFLNLLIKRGFDYDEIRKKTYINVLEEKEQLIKDKYNNFDIENNKYKKINDILNIPADKVNNYKDLFIDHFRLLDHFAICKFYRDSDELIKNELNDKNEFNMNKIKCLDNKIKFLKKLKRLTDNNDIFTIDSKQPKEDLTALNEEYKIIMNLKKNLDFNDYYQCNQAQYKLYNDIFDYDNKDVNCVNKKQISENKKRFYSYTVNKEYFEEDIKILKYRTKIDNRKRLI